MSKIKECNDKERKIIAISISENPLQMDKKYCNFQPPKEVIFKMHLVQVLNGDTKDFDIFIRENQDILGEICNRLVIYISNEVNYNNLSFKENAVFHVINNLKRFPIYKTIFSNNKDFIFEQDETNRKYNINKSYNIINTNALYQAVFSEEGVNYIEIVIPQYEGNFLTCQPWFRYYLSTLYSCGKGRLLQKSGTCYLNTVLNAFILSDSLRPIIIEKMKAYVSEFPNSLKYITSKLTNVVVCPNIYGGHNHQRLRYLFRILYNAVCKDERPFPRLNKSKYREDILIDASGELFNEAAGFGKTPERLTRTKQKSGGYIGGKPNMVFKMLLQDLDVSFKQYLLSDLFENVDSIPSVIQTFEMDAITKNTDIVIVRMKNSGLGQLEFTNFLSPNYKLESCFITLLDENKNEAHSILGFMCDNTPKIYDSDLNVLLDMNWPHVSHENWQLLEEQLNSFRDGLYNFNINMVVFVYVKIAQ